MDTELEALIDSAGRERVFAYAESIGWTRDSLPPKWVWQQICYELLRAAPSEPAP